MRTNPQPLTTLKIKSRPSVKAYLEKNFGSPVVIPLDHTLSTLVNSQLTRDNPRKSKFTEQDCFIELALLEGTFRFDGFNINDANTRTFNYTVSKYMRDLVRASIDSILIAQDERVNWKEKCIGLLDAASEKVKGKISQRDLEEIRKMKREIREFDLNISTAIEIACLKELKVEVDTIGFEAVKRDYLRYRRKKFTHLLSRESEKKISHLLSPQFKKTR